MDGQPHTEQTEHGPAHRAGGRRARGVGAQTRRQAVIAIVCGAGAIVAMALSSTLGNVHGPSMHQRLVAFIGAGAFFVLAIVAVQSASSSLTAIVTASVGAPTGGAVRIFVSLVGYIIVLFVGLGLLGVPLDHLLLGGVLTSVVVGIAAQQALGNVFAGIMLLFARPFSLGDRVRVRAGALGGIIDGVVTGMSLVYVTIRTDDGPINIPNSTLLAVGIGPAPSATSATAHDQPA